MTPRSPSPPAGGPRRRPQLPATPEQAQVWTLEPGAHMSRAERSAGYGGATYGGIQPSRVTDNVFVYSDPSRGASHGYDYDGWAPDEDVFFYTGEGRLGAQPMTKGNKAVHGHREDGRALRLFVADGTLPSSGAKDQLYLGRFEVDAADPYLLERAPDDSGELRDVFVFRLVPVGEVLRREQDGQHSPLTSRRAVPTRARAHRGVVIDLSGPAPLLTGPHRRWTDGDDQRLRRQVAAWLEVRSHGGAQPVTAEELRGVVVDGRRVPLLPGPGSATGVVVADGGDTALAVVTPYAPDGRERQFDDARGADGLLRLAWRGADGRHPENRALRRAMERGVPVVWLFGVGPASYLPVCPVFVLAEDAAQREFVVDPDVGHGLVAAGSVVEEHLRRYVVTETRRRLHQPVFRATVLRAYTSRCAVCSLRHDRLLDAAHVVPDSDPRGIASVRNGMALCKIHHAAFDADILGIRPATGGDGAGGVGTVEIRTDLLEERDGPMLLHGLQGHHGMPLRVVPVDPAEYPDPDLLRERYETFRSAG